MNPYDFFAEAARRAPTRTALADEGGALTYAEAARAVERLAVALAGRGVRAGTRVAVLAPNCSQALVAAYAVFRLGAVWLPVNTRNSGEQNAQWLRRCEVELLAFHGELVGDAAALQAAADLPLGSIALDTEGEGELPERWPHPDAVCVMLSTGGTTGTPKAVVWTERVVQTMIANFWIHIPCEAPPVYLAATPLTHAAGVISFCTMAQGATVIIHRAFKPQEAMRAIERQRVTHLFLPPTAIYAMLADPDVRSWDYASLHAFIYSAAPMAAEKIREAVEVFGPVMVQLYGQAEVPLMGTVLGAREHADCLAGGDLERLRSCGRPTLLVRMEIMDPEGRLLPAGEKGEVVVRSDQVMQGYYGSPEETAEVSRHGWHHTGDIGYKDADGYLYIVDRLKDMIISGGFNVFSSEVEQVVLAHPAVQDCAVVGQPDAHWGEAVTAVLQLKPGATLEIEELRALCRERLGGVKAPKHFLVWDDLPRSPVGKVLKREVREHFWQGRARRV